MASILILIIFIVWNIFCFWWHSFVPKVVEKMDASIREMNDLEPENRITPLLIRVFTFGSTVWKIGARPFMTIRMLVVVLFLIIAFLQSFH